MGNYAVEVSHLGKQYWIGAVHEKQDRLGRIIVDSFAAPFRKVYGLLRGHAYAAGSLNREIWALRDVSFKAEPGEVIGLIGRNGAGKSTLLKILTRITEPTEGRAMIRGRVGSLLEVGTGFHPELTGRENAFLNGAILGLSRAEIETQFDAIVEFSGIGEFIDTPVKHYSTGMYTRLAFAVAAHLEPDVLLVDEVLAVGDIGFQRKCLGKMHEVATSGRTVFFVSHNLGLVTDLCTRCILLSEGKVVADGEPAAIIRAYLATKTPETEIDLSNWGLERAGRGPFRFQYLRIENEAGDPCSSFVLGEPIVMRIGIQGPVDDFCALSVHILNKTGNILLDLNSIDDGQDLTLPTDSAEVVLRIPRNVLTDDTYHITLIAKDHVGWLCDRARSCLSFEVDNSSIGKIRCAGAIRLEGEWSVHGS